MPYELRHISEYFFFMWSLVVGVDINILLSTYYFLIQLVSGFTTLGTISREKLVYFFSLFCLILNFCFVSLLLYLRGSKLKKNIPFVFSFMNQNQITCQNQSFVGLLCRKKNLNSCMYILHNYGS